MAETSEHCLVCCENDNSTSTNADTDQGANSSNSVCVCKHKKLYPKIHFCGNIIWICSTCTIKGKKCNHCQEDLIDSEADTKGNLRHNQLFTDLVMAGKRENKNIYSSRCNEHIFRYLDFFCCIHNVPVCLDCRVIYHMKCMSEVKSFTESLDKTKRELNEFIKTLELNEEKCDDHLVSLEDQKDTINAEITEEFGKLHSYIKSLEKEMKTSVKEEYKKQKKIIQRQKDRMTAHKHLISRVLESPPDAAFFDMTQTLAAIVNSMETDISELNDVNVQMKFQERKEDLEEVIKSLEAMRFVSRESSQAIYTGASSETERTLYSNARSVSGPRGSININEPGMSHETENVVYVYTCTKCQKMYVGQTSRKLGDRDYEHRKKEYITATRRYPPGFVYKHNSEHGGEKQNHFVVSCVRKDLVDEEQRCVMERLIMLKLGTFKPDGLNTNLPRLKRKT